MNKRQYKFLWKSIQISLFFLPIIISLVLTSYSISWDKHYVNTVIQRALSEGYAPDKMTDFSDKAVAEYDAQGRYEKKVWKLNHQEIYYLEHLLFGIVVGLTFQIGNMIWHMYYIDESEDD